METNPSDEKFSSNDIPLVAFLIASGHKITDQTSNGDIVIFSFCKNNELLEDLYKYSSNCPYPLQTFYKSLSYVWTLIKQGRKNETP